MSLLAKLGVNVVGRVAVNVARRIAREAKLKRKYYRQGFRDASNGEKPKF